MINAQTVDTSTLNSYPPLKGGQSSFTPLVEPISFLPTIGDAISKAFLFIKSLGGLIKGGTRHLNWDDANTNAVQIAGTAENFVKTKYLTQFDAIGNEYRKLAIAWLQNNPRWDNNVPVTRLQTIQALQSFPASSDKRTYIFIVTWLLAMWNLQDVDIDSADEFRLTFTNDMNNTYAKAINSVTGKNDNISVPTDPHNPVPTDPEPIKSGIGFSFDKKTLTTVGIGAALLVGFIFLTKGR